MTIQDWATIVIAISAAMIPITTLLAPPLAEVVKFRLSQPKQIPDTSQPRSLTLRSVFGGKWAILAGGLVNLALLIATLLKSGTVTRVDVMFMAQAVGGIYYHSLLSLHSHLSNQISTAFDRLIKALTRKTEPLVNDAQH